MKICRQANTFEEILAMDEFEFIIEDTNHKKDLSYFKDIHLLSNHPAHMSFFLQFVISKTKYILPLAFWLHTFNLSSMKLKDMLQSLTFVSNLFGNYLSEHNKSLLFHIMMNLKKKKLNKKYFDQSFEKIKGQFNETIASWLSQYTIALQKEEHKLDLISLTRIISFEQEKSEARILMFTILKKFKASAGEASTQFSYSALSSSVKHYLKHFLIEVPTISLDDFKINMKELDSTKKGMRSFSSISERNVSPYSSISDLDNLKEKDSFNNIFISSNRGPFSWQKVFFSRTGERKDSSVNIFHDKTQCENTMKRRNSLKTLQKKYRNKLNLMKNARTLSFDVDSLMMNIQELLDSYTQNSNLKFFQNNSLPKTWQEASPLSIIKSLNPLEIECQEAIYELFLIEISYLQKLSILKNIYMEILVKCKFLSIRHASFLFCRIPEIFNIHQSLVKGLKNQIEREHKFSSFARIIKRQFTGQKGKHLLHVYLAYFIFNFMGMKVFEKKKKKNKNLEIVLEMIKDIKECKRLNFKEICASVYQQIIRYPLLMEQILKKSNQEEDEYYEISEAIMSIKKILRTINNVPKNMGVLIAICKIFSRIQYEDELKSILIKSFPMNCHHAKFTSKIKSMDVLIFFYTEFCCCLRSKKDRYYPLCLNQIIIKYEDMIMRRNALDECSIFLILLNKSDGNDPIIFNLVVGSANERDSMIMSVTLLTELTSKRKGKISTPLLFNLSSNEPNLDEMIEISNIDVEFLMSSIISVGMNDPYEKLNLSDEAQGNFSKSFRPTFSFSSKKAQ